MITTPTVLILGAGASAPFGYPVGGVLTEQIKTALSTVRPGQLHHDLVAAGFAPKLLSKFREKLRCSQRSSIDAFLEDWDSEFMDVGKAAIAASLLHHEDREKVIDEPNWYQRLFKELTDGGDFADNQLRIVTFNYDRSLEYYLLRCLPARYRISEATARKWLKDSPILHVYGSLGALPGLGNDARAYGKTGPSAIREAAKAIHLIRDDAAIPATFAETRKLMKDAHRIIFIGFGFEKRNADRLGIEEIPETVDVFATLFKLCPVDERSIKRASKKAEMPDRGELSYESTWSGGLPFTWFKGDALKFMEKHGVSDPVE